MTAMDHFWRFAKYMLRYRGALVLALIGALLSSACFGFGITAFKPIMEALLGADSKSLHDWALHLDDSSGGWLPDSLVRAMPTTRLGSVILVLVGLMILTAIGATGKYLHNYYAMDAAMRAIANIRKAAFYRIVHLPLKTVVSTGTMDQISRIIRDANQLRNGFVALTSKAVGEGLKGTAALIVAFASDWKLCLLAVLGAPLLVLTVRLFSRRVQKASKRALSRSASLLALVTQSMQGIRVVKVHTAERHEVGRFSRTNKALLAEELAMRQAKAMASPVVETMTVFGVCVLAALTAWYITGSTEITGTDALFTLFALGVAGATVRPLTQLSTDIHESAAAADRLGALLDQEIERSRGDKKPRLAPHTQSIAFRGVRYTYPGAEHPAIDRVDLVISHGETVAFVGPNGSGKTTLLSFIPRLFNPDEGVVEIDGVNISAVSRRSLRRQIGVVTQETVVFNDSIASNIAYGCENGGTREQIELAARQAFADPFIQAKPEGYDTVVGEQGTTLSGGERQKLAIARAILRNPQILILDEATSMIDADSEAQIAAALAEFSRNRTALVIAHRLSTVINADRIVVMSAGRILDVGKHDELLARCELYQQLCRTQMGMSNGNETANRDDIRPPS
ncbi:MAG: ABC transporter ATP-binding protein [Planctomycetes bacterium]|nr:ABC transporter ATP-binding protein [Planctomycetota bacterium]